MAAPLGNQNAAKGKQFLEALRRALAADDWRRLKEAAEALATAAASGEPWAIEQVANRLDGKPAQQTILTGDHEGGPIQVLTGVPRAD